MICASAAARQSLLRPWTGLLRRTEIAVKNPKRHEFMSSQPDTRFRRLRDHAVKTAVDDLYSQSE